MSLTRPHERAGSRFSRPMTIAERRGVHWVNPVRVGEVAFAE
jgi:hypothetical protein